MTDQALTPAEALDVVARTTDPNWFSQNMDDPTANLVLNLLASMVSKASDSSHETAYAASISTAPAGRTGVCDLILARTDTSESGLIPKGFKFVDQFGVELLLLQDIDVPVGQAQVILPLETTRRLDLVNTAGDPFSATLSPGDYCDLIISDDSRLVLDTAGNLLLGKSPLFGGTHHTLAYVSASGILGASMDWLGAHGDERAQPRQDGESDEAYRVRVRNIPDAVCPVAVSRAVAACVSQAGLPAVWMVEPMNDGASADLRLRRSMSWADSPMCNEDFFDDPIGITLSSKLPLNTLEMPSNREGRAYVRFSMVGELTEPDGSILYCDAGYFDDIEWGYPDVAIHPTTSGALMSLVNETDRKLAGGVQSDLFIENATVLNVQGIEGFAADALVWTLTAAANETWHLRDALVTCDNGGAISAPDGYKVIFFLADGNQIDTGWIQKPDGLPLRLFELQKIKYYGQPITKIEGRIDGTSGTFNLVGTFWVDVLPT